MAEKYLKLTGTDGLSKGEVFWIKKGEMVLMGRSHTCQLCLSDMKSYQELDPKDEISQTKFRTVDGKHLKIFFKNENKVILEDLSKNGTYVDGEKLIGQLVLEDLEEKPYILLLGLEERFRMELEEKEAEEESLDSESENQETSGEEEEPAKEVEEKGKIESQEPAVSREGGENQEEGEKRREIEEEME
ncbi:MAG: FHA domain-containing protein [Planctomycetota bacterium]|nr:MAG: FHA domain-containing protein [Planctomycetota bacterium]